MSYSISPRKLERNLGMRCWFRVFLTQVPSIPTDDNGASCPQYHLTSQQVSCITFTPEDTLLKDNQHDEPLYYIRYIGCACIERIQVDPGSALSIIPRRLLHFLGVLLSKLSTTNIINAGSSHLLRKIRLQCQIGDLKTEVTCYVIDATRPTTCCTGDRGFVPIRSSHPPSTNASSMLTIRQQ